MITVLGWSVEKDINASSHLLYRETVSGRPKAVHTACGSAKFTPQTSRAGRGRPCWKCIKTAMNKRRSGVE